ncbi:hypothetical protein U5B43_07700 [Campylobacter sp. 9BO]|uniref:hypothetical protein n=1 Tax=Campylobacter sp. 9BO TaxID=3424759 RepID=UPI003D34DD04
MKFLAILAISFGVIYLLIFAHYASFDRSSKLAEISALVTKIKDARPAFSFAGDEYRKFVYDR